MDPEVPEKDNNDGEKKEGALEKKEKRTPDKRKRKSKQKKTSKHDEKEDTSPRSKPKSKSKSSTTPPSSKGQKLPKTILDPLLSHSPAVQAPFKLISDTFSCLSMWENPMCLYELFLICRVICLMMIRHRKYAPSSIFGRVLANLLFENMDKPSYLRDSWDKVRSFWIQTSGTNEIIDLFLATLRELQKEKWYPFNINNDWDGFKEDPILESKAMKLLFVLDHKTGISEARVLIDYCKSQDSISHFLVIHSEKITNNAFKLLNQVWKTTSIDIEHVLWVDMMYYPYDKRTVSLHIRLTEEERDKYLQEHKLLYENLPPIGIYDKMIRFHGFAVGDVIQRNSFKNNGIYLDVRRVVLDRRDGLLPRSAFRNTSIIPTENILGVPSGDDCEKPYATQPLLDKPIHVIPSSSRKMTDLKQE